MDDNQLLKYSKKVEILDLYARVSKGDFYSGGRVNKSRA